jgi:hypothetical protein
MARPPRRSARSERGLDRVDPVRFDQAPELFASDIRDVARHLKRERLAAFAGGLGAQPRIGFEIGTDRRLYPVYAQNVQLCRDGLATPVIRPFGVGGPLFLDSSVAMPARLARLKRFGRGVNLPDRFCSLRKQPRCPLHDPIAPPPLWIAARDTCFSPSAVAALI